VSILPAQNFRNPIAAISVLKSRQQPVFVRVPAGAAADEHVADGDFASISWRVAELRARRERVQVRLYFASILGMFNPGVRVVEKIAFNLTSRDTSAAIGARIDHGLQISQIQRLAELAAGFRSS